MKHDKPKRCDECGRVFDGDTCPECGRFATQYDQPETDSEFVPQYDQPESDCEFMQGKMESENEQ